MCRETSEEAVAILHVTDNGVLAQGYGSGRLYHRVVLGQVLGIF